MKYRYKLLELIRNRDNLMRFLEVCDIEPKEAYDNPQNFLRMDEKLSLCAELTRIQEQIDEILEMPHGKVDEDCGEFTIAIPSKMNGDTGTRRKKQKPIPYSFSTWNPLR